MSETSDLRSIAQPQHEPFLWARLYGRRLSWPVTLLLLKTPLSANAVSVISIVVGVAGGLCFAFNGAAWHVAGVVLLLASWVLDCCDGEVARARGTCSLDGEFIDACRHQVVCPALFGGLTVGVLARHPGAVWLLALGLASTALSTRFTGGMIDQLVLLGVRRRIRRGELPERSAGPPTGAPGRGPAALARRLTPLFVDFNIMHILIAAVLLDLIGLRLTTTHPLGPAVIERLWTPLDAVHVAYGAAFPVVKLGSMLLAWRQGVSGRVEDVLRGRADDVEHHE